MKHTILCVDDEPDNVDALERLFRRKYNVLKATSGKEALKILKNEKIALIVTDQRMPGMTGVEFLAESQKTHPDTIRILLTGFTDIDSVIASINSGNVYRYVTKPWDPVDLANTIDKAIERYDLSAELKEKNQALQLALKELRSLDEAKSNFMILINHELKTPLTVMQSFLGLLNETDLSDEQKKYCARITTGSDRLHTLINDSLELVSAESGTLPIKMTSIDLTKLIKEVQTQFDESLIKKKMLVNVDLDANKVRSDAKALKSIVTRLFDNAIKFGLEDSTIDFICRELEDDQVEISMHNDGKGIKAELISKILKPFSLDEDIMHHSKGTGLGLSVVQALLHRLGSQLEVQSPRGKFSAKFTLPSA